VKEATSDIKGQPWLGPGFVDEYVE
jgi:hypothetical protein